MPRRSVSGARLANAFLIGAILCLVSASLYVLSRHELYSPRFLAVILGCGAAGILVLGIGLAAPNLWKARIALSLFAVGLALLAAESVVTYLDSPIARPALARQQGRDFDERRAVEVVQDLRSRGIEAYTLISPNLFLHPGPTNGSPPEFFPLAGVSAKTTVLCNESGSYVVYRSDHRGFRNPTEPPLGPPDVVLLGDSFAHGVCVDDGRDIAGQLRRAGLDVVNLGMGGSGPLIELAIHREYGERLEPRTAFWFYYEGNDLNDLHAEVQIETLVRYVEEKHFSQGLADRQPEIDAWLHRYFARELDRELAGRTTESRGLFSGFLQGASQIAQLKGLRRRISSLRTADSWHTYGPRLRAVLAQAAESLEERDGRLVFVYLPAFPRYTSPLVAASYRRREVLSMVAGLELPIIDLHPVFSRSDDPRSFFSLGLGPHYNEEGHAIVARELRRYLELNPRSAPPES